MSYIRLRSTQRISRVPTLPPLLASLSLLLLLACQGQQTLKSGEQRADEMEDQADSARAADARVADRGSCEEAYRPPVADSLGPEPIAFDTVSHHNLVQLLASGGLDTTLFAGGTIATLDDGEDCPALLYRASRRDSLWRRLAPGYRLFCQVTVEPFDWDGRPPLELLLYNSYKSYGTGGGESGEAISVITLGPQPQLLLRATTAQEDEQFTGYASMHGYHIPPGEELKGCRRTVRRQGRSLIFGPIQTEGNFKQADCSLTRLPAGRYLYRNGRVLRMR